MSPETEDGDGGRTRMRGEISGGQICSQTEQRGALSGPSEDDSNILPEPAPPDPTLNIVGSPITSRVSKGMNVFLPLSSIVLTAGIVPGT